MEDEIYTLELPIEAVKLIHKSLDFHHKQWSGGDLSGTSRSSVNEGLILQNCFRRSVHKHVINICR